MPTATIRSPCGSTAARRRWRRRSTLMDVIELHGRAGAGAVPGAGGRRCRRRGGRLRAPLRPAEHAVLAVRAHDPARGPRAQRGPVGRAAGRASGAASASGWAPPSAGPSTPSRRTCSGDASSARPRRSAYGIVDEVCRPDAAGLPGACRRSASGRCADLGRPPPPTGNRRTGGPRRGRPCGLRCGHAPHRSPPAPTPRRRVGRAADPGARELAGRNRRAHAHLHHPGPGRPRAVPALARLRGGAAGGDACPAGSASW